MRRSVAVIWHASFSVIAAVLYFFFVLPRWFELMGSTSHTLGTVLRIVTAALIGLAALPVVFTLLRTRRPEYGTPQLALRLRIASIALHVLAAALILGAAISEIWLDLDSAGPWLFGIYGAAAAIALLGIFGFYLAFVAEMPPPPPKPLKPKAKTGRRGRRKAAQEATTDEATADEATTEDAELAESDHAAEPAATPTDTSDSDTSESESSESSESALTGAASEADTSEAEPAGNGRLRNRRPSGKGDSPRRRRRSRGGIALED
ncbi:eL24 family ribosomal protein [Mycolicibacterium litorale]|uniref:Transmembrane protein n=1 Tax=Mycolicibacterium litorale TaxID=758802 RepID=A0AAD1MWY9_9MYCO|nr:hypothetical protein [Mycolicibacterium litorale]MCV7417844.1 hypothetical protein [Mycolicibacterium litorale]TDY06767.1 hypothetical protein BCL50_3101 [Mycolicibacterium litorale]BBY19077.1 hypothetical protein MLIT_46690 [Mycolicibacterium litorale]